MFYLEINKKNLNAYGAIGQATKNEVKKKNTTRHHVKPPPPAPS